MSFLMGLVLLRLSLAAMLSSKNRTSGCVGLAVLSSRNLSNICGGKGRQAGRREGRQKNEEEKALFFCHIVSSTPISSF